VIHLNCARKEKKRELSGIADGSAKETREKIEKWAALEVV